MRIAALFLSLIGLMVVGCGPDLSHLPKTVPASGKVTIDGNPVEGASVTFIADQGSYHCSGMTDASGQFVLKAFAEKTGAVPGSYKVEINKTVTGNEKTNESKGETIINVQYGLPAKYATFATSGLTGTIPEAGTEDLKFELSSK